MKMDNLLETLFEYIYLFKWGLITGVLFALASSFTSPFVILKRNALFPHALTHIMLLSFLSVAVFSPLIPVSLHFFLILFITLFLTYTIHILIKGSRLYEDTATSIVTHLSLGFALMLASKTSQYDATLLNYLFGSLLTVEKKETFEGLLVLLISSASYLKFRYLWLTETLEREVPGLNYGKSNLFLLLMITLQIMIGVKLMGVLLVTSFFVFSPTLALRLSPSFAWVIPITGALNLLAILGGFTISVAFDIPFSASAIIFMGSYIVFLFILGRK